ncbi:MAG: dicarboxylate/amino acid:cation symporter [Bacteroidales bacterium]|nr:dicarboxylate/amino acid:cation symporter [Bacteroidales bacterium]
MRKIPLHWQIVIALITAVICGIFFPDTVEYIDWVGIVFLRALQMIVVPLVFCSLISGVTNIGSGGNLGRIGTKTIGFYLLTSIIAIITGLLLVNVFKPGAGTSHLIENLAKSTELTSKPIGETLIEIIPINIIDALASGDMLSIILFALLFGFFITKIKSGYRKTLEHFFQGAFEVMMKITLFIIRFAPIGIFGIVVKVVAEQSDLIGLASCLGKFMLVVILGLAIHSFLTLPVLLKFIGKINPLKHVKSVGNALLTAFSTASSNATLPLTMECIEDNAGVSNKISSFTLPLGATINMDGTALYELVVVGFVAQLYGIDLTLSQQFIIILTALLSSIGTAGVPMASYVTMTIIFSAVGLPFEAMALIIPIDRPLDMLRTATNVFGDTCGATIIASSEGEKLKII